MVNQQVLEGRWNEVRGELQRRWGQLTGDELDQAHGDVNRLVGLIQQRTGESREQVEHVLDEVSQQVSTSPTIQKAAETARHYSQQATEATRQYRERAAEATRQYRDQAAEQLRRGYAGAEELVHQRPAQSLAVAFGAGLLAGVVVGLMLRSSD